MKKAASNNSTCSSVHNNGTHRYQFQQIVQPMYSFPADGKKPSMVENARLVQACECGHQLVNAV